ncbi:MAG: transcriptional repressor [Clostridia bacterium]|nr:transcriptional repressor [Clostridia bacterium]
MQERQTKQKSIIYDALKTLDHPTATEVYGYIHEFYPSVSRATVFRVLNGFAASSRALELKVAGSDVRYDYNTHPHYHVHCRECGKVADIQAEALSVIEKGVPKEVDGFSVERFSVEFFGICPECKGMKA